MCWNHRSTELFANTRPEGQRSKGDFVLRLRGTTTPGIALFSFSTGTPHIDFVQDTMPTKYSRVGHVSGVGNDAGNTNIGFFTGGNATVAWWIDGSGALIGGIGSGTGGAQKIKCIGVGFFSGNLTCAKALTVVGALTAASLSVTGSKTLTWVTPQRMGID